MLVNCNSCQKKFVVPDSAITKSGRLVQCGSCNNKWTQYPVKDIVKKVESKQSKTVIKKRKTKKNLYTAEYLKNKHGIIINDSNGTEKKNELASQIKKNSFGFYSYIIILFVFLSSLFGVLALTKEIIILKYPSTEDYINYLYEVIDIIKISLIEFINYFIN